MIVEGGKQNTHFEAHRKYLKALEDIKKQQQKKNQEEEVAEISRISTFDFFADDEDPSIERTPLNAALSKPYFLEVCSLGFLVVFFFVNNVILGDSKRE